MWHAKNMTNDIKEIDMLDVKIKKLHKDAVMPTYAKHGDAGMDLTAVSKEYDEHGNVVYGTGLAFEIPNGYVGYVFPRSSNSKKDLILSNSVGVIDSGYRGEVIFKFKPVAYKAESETIHEVSLDFLQDYDIGDRIGQIIIMPYPQINFIEVDELPSSDRGVGGFGSSDPVTKSIEDNYSV